MREKRHMLFSDEQRKEFLGSIRTSEEDYKAILEKGMSLKEAFSYAYLDVCRTLRGIRKCVGNSIEVRKQCISEICQFCENDLAKVQCEQDFDLNTRNYLKSSVNSIASIIITNLL